MTIKFIPLTAQYDNQIATVIRCVSQEYGLTADKGFSVADPHLDILSKTYQADKHAYWVVIDDKGQVLGGAGIAPISGEDKICELQKMYILESARKQGIATKLTQLCFEKAKEYGFESCYLETTACLEEALALYQKLGFKAHQRLGDTGHNDCEICLLKVID